MNETDSALQTAEENKEAKSIVMQKKNKVNPKKTSHSTISSCHTNDLPNEAMLSAKPKQVKFKYLRSLSKPHDTNYN